MPRVLLTAEERRQNALERRAKSLRGLIEHKMIEYGISKDTLAKTLCIAERALRYRLQSPAERLSVDEFAAIIGTLRISNDEIIEVMRKGVS